MNKKLEHQLVAPLKEAYLWTQTRVYFLWMVFVAALQARPSCYETQTDCQNPAVAWRIFQKLQNRILLWDLLEWGHWVRRVLSRTLGVSSGFYGTPEVLWIVAQLIGNTQLEDHKAHVLRWASADWWIDQGLCRHVPRLQTVQWCHPRLKRKKDPRN